VGSAAIAALLLYAGALLLIRSWINATPARLWAIAKQERERDEHRELSALQEATAVKVGAITRSLRDYDEQIAAEVRAQVAAAEMRARTAEARARGAEREASEATSMLAVVSELLRDVRATHQGLGELPPLVAALRAMVSPGGPAPAAAPEIETEEARQTIEMKPPASCAPPPDDATGDDDQPDEEMTKVAARPAAHMLAAPSSSGLRLAPARAAVPPPASGRGGAS
jgi:hypothetical protein